MRKNFPGPRSTRAHRRGLTLLELCVAMAVLAIALIGYAKVIANTTIASRTSREAALANEAARRVIETMRSQALANVFAMYNTTVADDPVGVTSPGADFALSGLEPRAGDADGMPGEILFPITVVGGGPRLMEDLVDTDFNMPADLTGEGTIDALDHSTNYKILPVIVRVRWQGAGGPGEIEYQTILGGF